MDMKTVCLYASLSVLLMISGCTKDQPEIAQESGKDGTIAFSSRNIARMLAELPIEGQNEEFKRLKKTGSVRSKQKIERLVCDRAEFVEDDA